MWKVFFFHIFLSVLFAFLVSFLFPKDKTPSPRLTLTYITCFTVRAERAACISRTLARNICCRTEFKWAFSQVDWEFFYAHRCSRTFASFSLFCACALSQLLWNEMIPLVRVKIVSFHSRFILQILQHFKGSSKSMENFSNSACLWLQTILTPKMITLMYHKPLRIFILLNAKWQFVHKKIGKHNNIHIYS